MRLPFFQLLDEYGIKATVMARRMGYSTQHFSDVRCGKVAVSPRFKRDAIRTLTEMGLRKEDDTSDLFEHEPALTA